MLNAWNPRKQKSDFSDIWRSTDMEKKDQLEDWQKLESQDNALELMSQSENNWINWTMPLTETKCSIS